MDNFNIIYKNAFIELIRLVDMCAKFDIDETNILANQYIERLCQTYFKKSYRDVLKKVYSNEEIIDVDQLKLKKLIES